MTKSFCDICETELKRGCALMPSIEVESVRGQKIQILFLKYKYPSEIMSDYKDIDICHTCLTKAVKQAAQKLDESTPPI